MVVNRVHGLSKNTFLLNLSADTLEFISLRHLTVFFVHAAGSGLQIRISCILHLGFNVGAAK